MQFVFNLFAKFQSHPEINVVLILASVFLASDVLCILFCICDLFQRITDAYNGINDVMIQFDWYRFPIQINRMLPIILMANQRPVNFECFGSISCNRETFGRVCFNHKIHDSVVWIFFLFYFFFRSLEPVIHILWCYVDLANEFRCDRMCFVAVVLNVLKKNEKFYKKNSFIQSKWLSNLYLY